MNKKVLIINTGGTLGMQKTLRGLSPSKDLISSVFSQYQAEYPSLPEAQIIHLEPLLDSSDISYVNWQQLTECINTHKKDYHGFIVLHGTDTMAFTASMLSFTLRGLNKAIIFTGSQIPLSDIRNDARHNLINAILFASMTEIKEVCLYFNNKLFRGNRIIKYSADGFAAFHSPHYPELANIGVEINIHEQNLLAAADHAQAPWPLQNAAILVLELHPNFQAALLKHVTKQEYQAIILRCFGKGTLPHGTGLQQALHSIIAEDILVIASSSCPQASVDLNYYSNSRSLLEMGIIDSGDMTFPATYSKLHFLLSQQLSRAELKDTMSNNLSGELSNL